MSETQKKIIDCIKLFEQCTKKQLYEQCAGHYYSNAMFHFGNILSNMVKKGLIERVSKGVYKLPEVKIQPIDFGLFKNVE